MEHKDIIVISVSFAAIGLTLYRKYVKKNQKGKPDQNHRISGSSFPSVKDDDYEPYSKK
jgi:hypothetical protein